MELRSGRLLAMAAAAGVAGEWAAVPEDLDKLAQAKMRFAAMAGTEAKVNMRGQHPLAQWGREQRKDRAKDKRKAKIAAASRRRNRNGKR